MKRHMILSPRIAAFFTVITLSSSAWAGTVQIGASDKTYASSAVSCAADPFTGSQAPTVDAGLFNPKRSVSGTVSLNGTEVASVTTNSPSTSVWLADGANTVVVAIGRNVADSYTFTVQANLCTLPDTNGNTYSADGTLEYAASGKSYATVTPGCALNPATGQAQPFVNLFDNGNYILNVSVNGIPLTQLSSSRPHTPVFLSAGQNVITAANGYVSTDYYIREGGDGSCMLPQ